MGHEISAARRIAARCDALTGQELDRLATAIEGPKVPWWAPWRRGQVGVDREAQREAASGAARRAEAAISAAGLTAEWQQANAEVETAFSARVRSLAGNRYDGSWALAWMARGTAVTDAALGVFARERVDPTDFVILTRAWRAAGLSTEYDDPR